MNLQLRKGFTLAEVMIVILIIATMLGLSFSLFFTGQGAWFASDVKIQLQENLRKTLQRLGAELRQTQVAQQNIFNGTGPGGSDSIRFSVPVICQSGGSFLDSNGNVAHWGSPLTWGCAASTCMDANNNCSDVEYKFLEYRLNSSKQLIREVLDGGLTLKRTDTIADNLIDFQVSINGKVITLTAQVQKKAVNNRILTASASVDIYLRN